MRDDIKAHSRPFLFVMTNFPLAKELLERLILPILLLFVTFLFGTVGYRIIGDGRWDFFDCAYMTSITLTTVGYGEVLDQMGSDARLFTMVLMWVGMGVTLYAVSTITAFVVERNLGRILRERRMERRIAALKNHFIVCGAGRTGFNVIKELIATRHASVLVDASMDRIEWIQTHFTDLVYLHGDPTDEQVLKRAGIERASGIVATLNEDSHNLLITVQARYVNPDVKIVTRCDENNLADKFYRAGANYVVNPAFIGGMRMASEMVRPHVVTFLDRMLRGQDQSIRVEEVTVSEGSQWLGRTLGEVEIQHHTGLLPIAMKHPEQAEFFYNPSLDERLQAGSVIIVIGNPAQVSKLSEFCVGQCTWVEE